MNKICPCCKQETFNKNICWVCGYNRVADTLTAILIAIIVILILNVMFFLSGCAFTPDKAGKIIEIVAKPEPKPELVKVDPDIALIKSFQWVETGDGCENGYKEHGPIVKTYTGFVTNPFTVLAEVPQDFTLAMGPAGCHITIPKSDPTGNMSKMGDRRAFLCLFNAEKVLVGTEDFNGNRLDNRWRNRDVAYGVVFHCQNNRVVSRSQVFKAGQFKGGE